jgi:pyridoxine kinase
MLLLGRDTSHMPQAEEEYAELATALGKEMDADVVLTSVLFEHDRVGCAVWEKKTQALSWVCTPHVAHSYHGTGDVFSSVLTAALLGGKSLTEAARIAAEFVHDTIEDTARENPSLWYGVNFEKHLSRLADRIASTD